MSLFDQLGNSNSMPDKNEMARMVQQLRNNPVDFMRQAGLNVPNNLNNPNAIISYFMQNGFANGGMLSKAQQLLKLFM